MIQDPLFYALAVPAVLIAGISKGGFGGGVGVLAVPLMALAVAPQQAAAVMLPILMGMDVMTVWVYRRSWHGGHLRITLPAAVVGIGIGWAGFGLLDAAMIRLLLGAIALSFSLDYWIGIWRRARPRRAGPDRLKGGFWGMLAGFTSCIAHAGGPPISVYLLPQGLDKRLFVGTLAIFFFAVNWLKVVPYGFLGQLGAANLTTSLVLLPLAPAGIWLGLWLQKRTPDVLFYRVCYALLFVTGIKLAWDGVTGAF